jgi:hypothetical protein
MHNYTFTMTRESGNHFISFPFEFDATIQWPAEEVWKEVKSGLEDHASGWMWPTQYSQPSVDAPPLRRGSRLILTYQIPNPNNPGGPKKNATYEFDIIAFDDDAQRYEYRATPEHPFLRGGGAVWVTAIDSRTSRLKWAGLYQHIADHKGKEAQGDVFAHFLCMFFTSLAQNIKRKVGYATTGDVA